MLRFAEPIYNARPLWFSPGQSTFCRNFTLRALNLNLNVWGYCCGLGLAITMILKKHSIKI